MSGRRVRDAVAAVILTAAVAAAGTGCGSGDDASGERGGTPAAGAAASPAPHVTTERPDRPEKAERREKDGESGEPDRPEKRPEENGGDRAEALPKVPKAELTPATGSFTGDQKEYLVDRVPRGTDPASVLEAGKAACDRITRTAKVDREAAVSALKSGEIANAEAAVTHLCPKHEPLLKAAGLTG